MRIRVATNPEGMKRLRKMNEALKITTGDLAGPVLKELGFLHRKQQKRIFASEGREGGSGRWPKLHPKYAARKKKVFGRKKIMELSGDMKKRFTKASDPAYVQRYSPSTKTKGLFRFGAMSDIAAAHRAGNPGLATVQSDASRKVFGGKAKRLPVRDVVSKTTKQTAEFRQRLVDWYRKKRVPQVLRHFGPQIRKSRPGAPA